VLQKKLDLLAALNSLTNVHEYLKKYSSDDGSGTALKDAKEIVPVLTLSLHFSKKILLVRNEKTQFAYEEQIQT
jgi:hypothetical protein